MMQYKNIVLRHYPDAVLEPNPLDSGYRVVIHEQRRVLGVGKSKTEAWRYAATRSLPHHRECEV